MNTPKNAPLQGPVRMEEVHFRGSPTENEGMISYAVKLLVEKILLDPEKGRVSLEELVKNTNDQVEFEKKALEEALKFLEGVFEKVKTGERRKVGVVSQWYGCDESGVSMSEPRNLTGPEMDGDAYDNDLFYTSYGFHKHGHDSNGSLMIGEIKIAGSDGSVDYNSNYLVSNEGLSTYAVSQATYQKFIEALQQKISEGLIRDRRNEQFPESREGEPQEIDDDEVEEELQNFIRDGDVIEEELKRFTRGVTENPAKTLEAAKQFLHDLVEKLKVSEKRKVGVVWQNNDYEDWAVKMAPEVTEELKELTKQTNTRGFIEVSNNDLFRLSVHGFTGQSPFVHTTMLGNQLLAESVVDEEADYRLQVSPEKSVNVPEFAYNNFLQFLETKVSEGLMNDRREELAFKTPEREAQDNDSDGVEDEYGDEDVHGNHE